MDSNVKTMATDRNAHLEEVLTTHDISKLDKLDKFVAKKNLVKEKLSAKFSSEKASSPIDSGSYAKRTAINSKFDIDCCVPFKKKTNSDEQGFETLEDMYNQVYSYLRNEYTKDDEDIKSEDVRKQKVSVGMLFDIDGEPFELDVVPGRERPNYGSYNDDSTDLSLYIVPSRRSQKEVDDGKTRIKTNIKKHVGLLAGEGRRHERKVARLLKVWKTERVKTDGGKLIKSFVMEVYTKDAFDTCEEIPVGLWEKTKMVMQYIVDKIESENLKDPANSQNVISDSISDSAKTETRRALEKTIADVTSDSDTIKDYFPINPDYQEEEERNDAPSVLKTTKFG